MTTHTVTGEIQDGIYPRPIGMFTSAVGERSSGVPWGHVGSEAVSAVVAGTGAFVVGSGTVAIGGLMAAKPPTAPALVGVLVIGMSETIARGIKAAQHVQGAYLYATSDKPFHEVHAEVEQLTESSMSPIGNVVEKATDSKDAGKLTENYIGTAVAAMNTLSPGLAVFAIDVASPAQNMLKRLDNPTAEGKTITPQPSDTKIPMRNETHEMNEGYRSSRQGDKGHYEPAPRPESEESSTSHSHL